MFEKISLLVSEIQDAGTINLALLIVGLSLLIVWRVLGNRGK
ncbi:MAG: hypothetical protein JWL65_3775 [Gammaproteobacteria bacterium]|nr:hypothetical protein [Gammaproteobacteria bacterium]